MCVFGHALSGYVFRWFVASMLEDDVGKLVLISGNGILVSFSLFFEGVHSLSAAHTHSFCYLGQLHIDIGCVVDGDSLCLHLPASCACGLPRFLHLIRHWPVFFAFAAFFLLVSNFCIRLVCFPSMKLPVVIGCVASSQSVNRDMWALFVACARCGVLDVLEYAIDLIL